MSNPTNPLSCGCRAVGVAQLDGYGSDYTLVQTYRDVHVQLCRLHAQAEGMREFIETLSKCVSWTDPQTTLDRFIKDARALLRAVEGRQTP